MSAQPDSNQFFWQLEIFLNNVSKLSYTRDDVHVLIGFNPYEGVSPTCKQFQKDYADMASIYVYPDIRVNKVYTPSLRPHIIKQHFALNCWLQEEVLFYHDSDIVFTKPIDFAELEKGGKWYVSDTRVYLNADYIKACGEIILDEMCTIVGIDRQIIEAQNDQAGGAQYVLKNVDYLFWDKVEKDSELLFKHLTNSKARYAQYFSDRTGLPSSQHRSIQAWCSDMWAVLWNGYFFGHQVEIHQVLDFCWPIMAKQEWENKYIYHDAGVTNEYASTYFEKARHNFSVPFYFTNDHVIEDSCSAQYVKLIGELKKNEGYQMHDVTFLIPVRIDSDACLKNVTATLEYLNKYFDTNIIVLEADTSRKINPDVLPGDIEYTFLKDELPVFRHSTYNNILLSKCKTPIICLYDMDVIIPPDQIYKSVLAVRYGEADLVSPYDGNFYDVRPEIRGDFLKSNNVAILNSNVDKFFLRSKYSWRGAIFANYQTFKDMGCDNENILGYGHQDSERVKRAEILGYKVKRQIGPLFHLKHDSEKKSRYFAEEFELANKMEYLKICNMTKDALKAYTNS